MNSELSIPLHWNLLNKHTKIFLRFPAESVVITWNVIDVIIAVLLYYFFFLDFIFYIFYISIYIGFFCEVQPTNLTFIIMYHNHSIMNLCTYYSVFFANVVCVMTTLNLTEFIIAELFHTLVSLFFLFLSTFSLQHLTKYIKHYL